MSKREDAADPAAGPDAAKYREVRYEHSSGLGAFLEHLASSLVISTYQAGKLAVVHAEDGRVRLSFHNFDQPMGVAVHPQRLALGARGQVWSFRSEPDIARRMQPPGSVDACFVARSSHVTGEIQGHEMAWSGGELWIVNTLFSCLATLKPEYSFVPRWKPPFITALAPEDRCHLNGLAMAEGRPRYVTALSTTDTPAGWRPDKASSGCVIDVPSGQIIARGLCMPHSPRIHDRRLWVLDSGKGEIACSSLPDVRFETVATLPGYTRGLCFQGPYAFLGLSKIRETSTFGGVPVAERRDELKCGVWVVDVRSGETVVFLEFKSGVDEIFDVQLLSGVRRPRLAGPNAAADDAAAIWIAPPLSHS